MTKIFYEQLVDWNVTIFVVVALVAVVVMGQKSVVHVPKDHKNMGHHLKRTKV